MGPLSVLLIEDCEPDRARIRHLMSETRQVTGRLREAETLAGGLASATEQRPDVILLKLNLPDAQGLETLRRIHAQFADVPVVVLAGLANEYTALAALQTGAQDYVAKGGLDGDTLGRVLRYAVERHQAQAALRQYQDRLDDLVEERSASLVRTNRLLEDEVRRHCRTEQELRDANVRLSDALVSLKQAQRSLIQSERLTALGQMAGRVMHDFNNALAPIQGYTELLLDQPELLEQRMEALKILHEMHAAVRRAAEEIRQLRACYRPAPDHHLDPLDLNRLLTATVERQRTGVARGTDAGRDGVEVAWRLGAIPPLPGRADELQEAFAHIILNALEAMPAGGTLTLETRCADDWVEAEIADTGAGMDESTLQRCFEPFFSTKGRHAAGIGLAVVHGVVRAHGGRVEVHSRQGEGTRVRVRLPRETPAPPAMAPAPAAAAAPDATAAHKPLRILVIDDDPVICRMLGEHFRSRRHEVATAESGRAGLALASAGIFDLVITDRAMPDLSGDEVAAQIRRQNARVPILMLTGIGDLMQDTGVQPPGVNGVVSKPVALETLDRVVAGMVA